MTTDAIDDIDTVRHSVEARGFVVDRVMGVLGQMSGRAPETTARDIASLGQIASVDPDTSMRIAPPDSDVQ